ncbi:ileal sodium/bile acid cotransporter-like [Centruroides vittatus]|uniref:ileal sodium/bile acid cotransporter-like n=1 Tax=Centruroides vittatus TaxID=120091 RepID=UPI0035102FC1
MNENEDSVKINLTSNYTNVIHFNEDFKKAQDILIIILIILIMVAMGADICFKQIWMHIRIPFGPVIGLLCQFVMMPLVGFVYNKIFKFQSGIATGLLIISCCPGGAVSNAFTYFLNGDVSLSVTMTTISTILALGMMPLNMWIYAIRTEANTIIIPYKNIGLSLIIITSPILLGMVIRWKIPKISTYVTKGGSALGFMILTTVLILEFIAYHESFHQVSWKLIVTSICMPITGMILGYLVAFICKRPQNICITIAIESGIQNAAVAFSVIVLSFDIRKHISILLIPWFYGTAQVVICGILSLICYIYKKYLNKQQPAECVKSIENQDIQIKQTDEMTRF